MTLAREQYDVARAGHSDRPSDGRLAIDDDLVRRVGTQMRFDFRGDLRRGLKIGIVARNHGVVGVFRRRLGEFPAPLLRSASDGAENADYPLRIVLSEHGKGACETDAVMGVVDDEGPSGEAAHHLKPPCDGRIAEDIGRQFDGDAVVGRHRYGAKSVVNAEFPWGHQPYGRCFPAVNAVEGHAERVRVAVRFDV